MSEEAQGSSGYTVVGVLDDDAGLNQAVLDLRELGVGGEDLTVIFKRRDPEETEPLPAGARYIVVPDDSRGLELALGFAALFVLSALIFAFTTPTIGAILFLIFISVAAILVAGSLTKVGATPILINMEAPAEESGYWNDEFERGKVLLFASTEDRRNLKPMWEVLRRQGLHFDIVGRRLEPQPVSGAVLHQTTAEGGERLVEEAQGI